MNQLKRITNRAKQIRRDSPGVSWKSALKKAGAEFRSGSVKKASAKKSTVKRSPVKRSKKTVVNKSSGSLDSVSSASLVAALKRKIVAHIDNAVVKKYHATTKTERRRLQKVITEKKSDLKKLG